ncbi:MAG TPA: glycosyltransferase [Candidatus Bipolaricaulota bacterium]|nr:glycosyltransferase [Candidatus Bipolaricaulota bacterium]
MSPYSDWRQGIFNRNYFILQNLQKDPRIGKILAIDFLPLKLSQAPKYYFKNLMAKSKNKNLIFGDLTSMCYRESDKIYVYSSIDSLISPNIVLREISGLLGKLAMTKNLVVWSYNPMFMQFETKIKRDLFVFDTVDNWTEHKGYLKLMSKKKLIKNYERVAAKADSIFTVSKELIDFYKKMGRDDNLTQIANGVDAEFFDNFNLSENLPEIKEGNKKIIGYSGTIQNRFDVDLAAYLAKKNPDKILVLLGPIWREKKGEIKKKLGNLSNVKLLGRIKYTDLPAYLNQYDVCIIPHKIDNFIKSTDPMKLYDYLAAGKPVVTTRGAGVEVYKNDIYIADDFEQFNKFVNEALKEDSAEMAEKRKNIARKQDWKFKVGKMIDIVENKL